MLLSVAYIVQEKLLVSNEFCLLCVNVVYRMLWYPPLGHKVKGMSSDENGSIWMLSVCTIDASSPEFDFAKFDFAKWVIIMDKIHWIPIRILVWETVSTHTSHYRVAQLRA